MIRISNIKIRKDISKEELLDFIIEKNKISKNDILECNIYNKYIYDIKKEDVHYIY